MTLSRPLLEQLLRLNSPEFQDFRQWVAGKREQERDNCEKFEGSNCNRAQGKAQAWGELKELIETARAVLEKTSSRP